MTGRNQKVLLWAGWIAGIAGLLIGFAGLQSQAFLDGKSAGVGSVIVLIGIIMISYGRRKVPN